MLPGFIAKALLMGGNGRGKTGVLEPLSSWNLYPDLKQIQFTLQKSPFSGMIYVIWESSLIISAEHLQAAG